MISNMIAMEDCTTVKGVFLYTKNLDSELMLRCLQILLNNFPGIKFTSITTDEKFHGYRVHISSPDEEVVLAKKHLSVSGQDVWIYPLTAQLTIHDINANGNTESEIREGINRRYGRILQSVSIPRFPGLGNESAKNWRVCVDVPEIKGLEIFDHEGFPEMCMWLPDKDQKLKVTLYCRLCKKDGHFQQDCLHLMQLDNVTNKERVNSKNSKTLPTNFERPFDISLEPTETYAEKIGREEIMKTGMFWGENQKTQEADPPKISPEAKESGGIDLKYYDFSSVKIKEETNGDDSHSKVTVEKSENKTASEEKSRSMSDDNDYFDSNSLSDDDIQVVQVLENSNSSNQYFKSEDKAKVEDPERALLRPAQTAGAGPSRSTSSFAPGPSGSNLGTPKHSISVEVTSNLSESLQNAVDAACSQFRILDRKRLDAFLTHVKKKSNPIRVACNYTQDAAGLKEQLQHILKLYYNAPQTGAKGDIQFIKWLNGLVERFKDPVFRKRKRSGKCNEVSPNKK